jgi:uncharacterized protein YcfJ
MEVLMKATKSRLLVAGAAIALSGTAAAANGDTFMQWAPVIRVTPVYTHVSEPQQQCWTERVTTTDEYIDRNGTSRITMNPITHDVQRCRTVDTGRDVLDGYDVTYRYQNRDFTTRLAYDPGDRIQVRVDVAPTPG